MILYLINNQYHNGYWAYRTSASTESGKLMKSVKVLYTQIALAVDTITEASMRALQIKKREGQGTKMDQQRHNSSNVFNGTTHLINYNNLKKY